MKYFIFLFSFILTFSSCFNKVQEELCQTEIPPRSIIKEKLKIPVNPTVSRNGKKKDALALESTYNFEELGQFSIPEINDDLINGLKNQLELLKKSTQSSVFLKDDFYLSVDEMEETVNLLLQIKDSPESIGSYLESYLLDGDDGQGNLYMTGYYSPTIEADYTRSEKYNYPIYKYPKNWSSALPSREEIDGPYGALEGTNNEIAYAKNLEDIYFMQVQGSGYIKYPDGKTQYLAYDGSNRRRYRSIEQYMIRNNIVPKGGSVSIEGIKAFFKQQPYMRENVLFKNPSYVFFKKQDSKPIGSGGVPLTAKYSIAVDRDFIPVGSTLLAAVPIYQDGRIVDHEYRILLAQDVGGAIKGSGHIDVYSGVGTEGEIAASQLHHYGKLWLLKPKSQT